MRTIITGMLLGCFAFSGKSQISYGLYGYGARQQSSLTMPTLEPLLQDINATYAGQLTTPFSNPVFKNHVSWGGGFFFMAIGMDMNFGRQLGYAEAVFANGEKFEMNLDSRESEFDFNFFLPLGKFGRVGGFIGWSGNKGALRIGYRYTDGDLSYGFEKPMTGIYSYNSFRGAGGFKAMLGYKYINFFFKAGFIGFMDKLTGDTKLGLKDNLGGGFSIFGNYLPHLYLPQTVAGQDNLYAYNIGSGDLVMQQMRGWKFQLGAALILGKFKSKED